MQIRYFLKLVSLSLLLLIASSVVAVADCNFNSSNYLEELSTLETIENITVHLTNTEKWLKTILNAGKKFALTTKDKKKHRARLQITYPFGTCNYVANVRLNGDWLDHLKLNNGVPYPSLDVSLKHGNLAHFTNFKFFRPETRQFHDEIMATELLQALGYISPTTRYIPVTQSKQQQSMLVQVKASKEMLEYHQRREGAIYEGNEKLIWDYRNKGMRHRDSALDRIALARLVNAKWAAAGDHSTLLATKGVNHLQTLFFIMNKFTFLPYKPHVRQKNAQYDLLIHMFAKHATAFHNRKFFYNNFTQSLEPIYYDGDVEFKKTYEHSNQLLTETVSVADIADLIVKFENIIASDFADRVAPLLTAQTAIIAPKKYKAPENNYKYVTDSLNNIRDSLKTMLAVKQNLPSITHKIDIEQEKTDYKKKLFALLNDAKTVEFVKFHADNSLYQVEICSIDDCQLEKLTRSEFVAILRDKYNRKDQWQPHITYIGSKTNSDTSKKTYIKALNLSITHSPDVQINYNQAGKKLLLRQTKYNDWFLIKNAAFKDITIELVGIPPTPQELDILAQAQRFNQYGLTACLTFYEVDFDNSKLIANQGGCEDSINIANSTGTIAQVNIKDAFADALDVDFSEVAFTQLDIARAGNDCLDYSGGNYHITTANLNICGDKGISVGEASQFHAEHVTIRQSNIGISSKDSSTSTIVQFQAQDLKLCAEAFKKKQEFNGAILKLISANCDSKYENDENSQILFMQTGQ